jgi:hypothetical protein
MVRIPVHLNHQPVLGPVRVDLDVVDPDVDLGQRYAAVLAKVEEAFLELAVDVSVLRAVLLQG